MSIERKQGFEELPFIRQAGLYVQRSALLLEIIGHERPQIPQIFHSNSGGVETAYFDFRGIPYDGFNSTVLFSRSQVANGAVAHEITVFPKPDHNGHTQTIFTGGLLGLSYQIETDGSIDTSCKFQGKHGDVIHDRFGEVPAHVKTEIYLHDHRGGEDPDFHNTLPQFNWDIFTESGKVAVEEWGPDAEIFLEQSNVLLVRALNAAEGLATLY